MEVREPLKCGGKGHNQKKWKKWKSYMHVYGCVEITTKLGKRRKMEVIGIALSTNPKVVLDLIDLWPLHLTMFRVNRRENIESFMLVSVRLLGLLH